MMIYPDMTPLAHGDALEVAQRLEPQSFRLIYIDPPYFTGKQHTARKSEGGFNDQWAEGLNGYLEYLAERIAALKPLLTADGALLLHLDWRAVHHAKVRCDEIFGPKCFLGEIIWSYNSGGGSKYGYGHKHDTILWYGRGRRAYFDVDAARVPYESVIAKKRSHLFNPKGKVSGDVIHIPRPPNHSKEWTGWPTQKPLDLLRFLVRCHSAPGDLVGDFFCGSGTTLVAAKMEGRRGFGTDLSIPALDIAKKRLSEATVDEGDVIPDDREIAEPENIV